MRKKIFIILFTGISLFTLVTTTELVFFFKRERARLIDQQVEVLATSILAAGVFESRFDEAQAQISKALGTRETIAFLSFYDPYLNLRFRNPNAQILFGSKVIEPKTKWMTLHWSEHRVRLLNLRTNGGGSWIQVGMLIDQENAEWDSIAQRAFIIVGLLVAAIAIASYFLSRATLLPLSELANDLKIFSNDLESRRTSEHIFSKWSKKTSDGDAFSDLIKSLVEMRSRLVDKLKMNDATLSHMAHELKTPLAVIRAGTESLFIESKNESDRGHLEELINEADRLSDTITSFLSWSRFQQIEFQNLSKAQFALGDVVDDIISGLATLYPNRLKVTVESSIVVEENRQHVEQAMRNLVTNALKYSSEAVDVFLYQERFSVVDRGPGIPESILARVGEPFNSGASGTGLGLAWIKTLSNQHNWDLKIDSCLSGTRIDLTFKV